RAHTVVVEPPAVVGALQVPVAHLSVRQPRSPVRAAVARGRYAPLGAEHDQPAAEQAGTEWGAVHIGLARHREPQTLEHFMLVGVHADLLAARWSTVNKLSFGQSYRQEGRLKACRQCRIQGLQAVPDPRLAGSAGSKACRQCRIVVSSGYLYRRLLTDSALGSLPPGQRDGEGQVTAM